MKRIVFAGTPEFAVPSLAALVAHGFTPVAVYTQPDRPAGRGRALTASPVKAFARAAGIPVVQPPSLNDPGAVAAFGAWNPDLLVVVAYGQLLKRRVLSLPTLGCINVHASLLPRWRGAAPIQHAILAGDTQTGVSIMQMDAGLDTGPVLMQRTLSIGDDDTAATLHARLAPLGAAALVDALAGLAAGTLRAAAQGEVGVTLAPKLEKHHAWLDWTLAAEVLARQVRAFDPWPVAQTRLDGEVLRIWRAEVRPSGAPRRDSPGTITDADEAIDVATGNGVLRLLEVQAPGGRRITARAFAQRRGLTGLRLGP